MHRRLVLSTPERGGPLSTRLHPGVALRAQAADGVIEFRIASRVSFAALHKSRTGTMLRIEQSTKFEFIVNLRTAKGRSALSFGQRCWPGPTK